ncbi:MAG: DUF1592 domain-containing protein [Verrucomicrobia bacterium]|nr:DUF1592 domain-containing protein [Verrucomicrobiota bacterium]
MLSPRAPARLSAVRTILVGMAAGAVAWAAEPGATVVNFRKNIEPLLKKYCYDCHADGVSKGKVSFDTFSSDAELVGRHDLWFAALKNVRAGIMPPLEDGAERPSAAEVAQLTHWIKYEAFGLNPSAPDPGRVTVRRLNRTEYRNTINDLMGVEFNSDSEFPPDDTGNGFDNIGDVLTVSPLLLEKYLQAAEFIVDRAVPKVAKIMTETTATGREFRGAGGAGGGGAGKGGGGSGAPLLITRPAKVSRAFHVDQAETYKITAELEVRGSFDFDPGRGTVICRVDGVEWFREAIAWSEKKTLSHVKDMTWSAGSHTVAFEIVPDGAKEGSTEKAAEVTGPNGTATRVDVRIVSVQVKGPLDPKHWTAPANYARFFPDGPAPADAAGRARYAAKLLGAFAARAYRRPVDAAHVAKLVEIARGTYTQPGRTFEEGIGRAMMGVLASPRFLFRIEAPLAGSAPVADVDDYTLASRLSYFLWSTMPDDELIRLASRGELRRELRPQVARMLADPKAQSLVKNFIGQWLQVRDIESVPINARAVLGPSARRNRDGRIEFDGPMRRAMRSETEMCFDHILKEDRSVLELLESNYTFLNQQLATHYGIPDVTGDQMRLVQLPPGSPRGGVLTQGSVLAVTSNPTRTSPVKRGLFVLDNILGTPPPPPPPDVPALEDAAKAFKGREPKLSEMLAVHRANKLCSSCHERMDPLGLAFENFNAMGIWRDKESQQTIEVAGQLVTGEKFASVSELKHILTHERHLDYYRCITEKLLTYGLGRGLDHRDTESVDQIVDRLEREGGKMSALLFGVIDSTPFQKLRRVNPSVTSIVSESPTVTQVSTKVSP